MIIISVAFLTLAL